MPTMVMEYWTGWFDSWGGPHNVFDADGKFFAGAIPFPPASKQRQSSNRLFFASALNVYASAFCDQQPLRVTVNCETGGK